MAGAAYTEGLHELGDSRYAYLQPDGGRGWSNALVSLQPMAELAGDTA
jgi:hypothetical protein